MIEKIRKPVKKLSLSTEKRKFFEVFQRAVVYEEADENGMVYCISSGKLIPIREADGGHLYKKSTHPRMAMCRENVHAQCRHDNRFDEGATTGYRAGIIKKYGQEYLDRLDTIAKAIKGDDEAYQQLNSHDRYEYVDKKWTAQDYRAARLYYQQILDKNRYKEQI